MGDVPIRPPAPPTKAEQFADSAAEARAVLSEALKIALTGTRTGRTRRPVLFLLAIVALGTAPWSIVTVVGLMALILLALGDAVTEL